MNVVDRGRQIVVYLSVHAVQFVTVQTYEYGLPLDNDT